MLAALSVSILAPAHCSSSLPFLPPSHFLPSLLDAVIVLPLSSAALVVLHLLLPSSSVPLLRLLFVCFSMSFSTSRAVILWLPLLIHALVCSQLLCPAAGQAAQGCYPFTPQPTGEKIADSNSSISFNGSARIVGVTSWYSSTMDVICNFTMLYSDGSTGYVDGPTHGYGDSSCDVYTSNENSALFKRDWFFTGGSPPLC
jgi:hypothetical protein